MARAAYVLRKPAQQAAPRGQEAAALACTGYAALAAGGALCKLTAVEFGGSASRTSARAVCCALPAMLPHQWGSTAARRPLLLTGPRPLLAWPCNKGTTARAGSCATRSDRVGDTHIRGATKQHPRACSQCSDRTAHASSCHASGGQQRTSAVSPWRAVPTALL